MERNTFRDKWKSTRSMSRQTLWRCCEITFRNFYSIWRLKEDDTEFQWAHSSGKHTHTQSLTADAIWKITQQRRQRTHTHTPNAQRKVCVDFCSLFIPCIVSIIDRRASRVCMCIRVYHLLLAVTFRLPAHCCTRDNNGVPFLSSNYFSSI